MFEDTSPNSFLGEISIENSIFFISDVSIFFSKKKSLLKLNIVFFLRILGTTFKNYKDQKIFYEY